MLKKKVYTSGSSCMISLPRKWVQANSPGTKSYVLLDVQEDCIIMEPVYIPEPEETVIESRDISTGELQRRIIASYLAGYNIIRTKFDRKSIKLKEEAKEILNSLIAVEIIRENEDEITAQVFIDQAKIPVLKVVERISSIVKRMLVGEAAFSTQNIELIEHTISREKEIDRLYFLAVCGN